MEYISKKTRKLSIIGVHILGWSFVLAMPLLSVNNATISLGQYLRTLTFPLFFGLVFYANYFFLIKVFLFTKRLFIFFTANIVLYSLCIISMEFRRQQMMRNQFHETAFQHVRENGVSRSHHPSQTEMILRAFFGFALTTGASVAIRTTTKWFRSQDILRDLEREHLKSELANLKNQLNPHFLFNTLNNIYGLIIVNQDKAQEAVHQLSKLMRYLLYESNEKFVSLTREVEFMHHYIDLMKLRVNTNVHVSYKFPSDCRGYMIAPLLFISLIENSFKHGISPNKPSEINMTMSISEGRLVFIIMNTSFPKRDNDRSGSGIGLENLEKRLRLLYPGSHSMNINTAHFYYQTILTVNL
ncbi:sensor histidine kinase [Pseudochryseolinea flava]|uniref:Sensor histidine kinase n=1 Tax=Pseudochryseolinea flava TaxID=2059302 RepID=A0A364Y087_9BACT|nr:histidine kinase [Pseudochryseolinea flava]RAW00011.1 sensor histidine kinase [Pseudochryseolinea flava]